MAVSVGNSTNLNIIISACELNSSVGMSGWHNAMLCQNTRDSLGTRSRAAALVQGGGMPRSHSKAASGT